MSPPDQIQAGEHHGAVLDKADLLHLETPSIETSAHQLNHDTSAVADKDFTFTDISWKTWGAVVALFFTSFVRCSTVKKRTTADRPGFLLHIPSCSFFVNGRRRSCWGYRFRPCGLVWYLLRSRPGCHADSIRISLRHLWEALLLCASQNDSASSRSLTLVQICGTTLAIIACIIGSTAKTGNEIIISMTILGFSSGLQGLGAAAMAEILPNKYKPFTSGLQEISIALWQVFAGLFAYLLAGVGWTRGDFIIGCVLRESNREMARRTQR